MAYCEECGELIRSKNQVCWETGGICYAKQKPTNYISNVTPTITYKGKPYKLLWSGKTKYGMRSKLGFMDGSKEFWIDNSLIQKK